MICHLANLSQINPKFFQKSNGYLTETCADLIKSVGCLILLTKFMWAVSVSDSEKIAF